jgi:hypothetical protein
LDPGNSAKRSPDMRTTGHPNRKEGVCLIFDILMSAVGEYAGDYGFPLPNPEAVFGAVSSFFIANKPFSYSIE